jgi:alpha-L-fucosidase
MLIETRAKGGNLLLNVGPRPDGEIPIEQEARMRELALWMYVNQEAVYHICPWYLIREGNVWYTCASGKDTVYAILTRVHWPKGQRMGFTLKQVRASADTEIEILGQSGKVLEYNPDVNPKARWTQDETGLHISAMRAQRLYNNSQWPNPVVIEITHAQRGLHQ